VNAEKLKSKQDLTYQIMKKVIMLITVLCFLALSAVEAQVNKGRTLIGVSTSFSYVNFGSDLMSLGFASIKQKSNAPGYVEPAAEKFTTFNFLPKFGYFVINNLAIGLDACIASSSEKSGDWSKYSTTYFGLGPFVRYYVPGSKVMPFFEVNSLFGSLNVKDEYQSYSSSNKTGMSSIGAGAGIAVKLGDKVTFDMMAGYNSMSEKSKQDNPNDERTIQRTIGFKFGFAVLLGSK
jgi:hypothetical protein